MQAIAINRGLEEMPEKARKDMVRKLLRPIISVSDLWSLRGWSLIFSITSPFRWLWVSLDVVQWSFVPFLPLRREPNRRVKSRILLPSETSSDIDLWPLIFDSWSFTLPHLCHPLAYYQFCQFLTIFTRLDFIVNLFCSFVIVMQTYTHSSAQSPI